MLLSELVSNGRKHNTHKGLSLYIPLRVYSYNIMSSNRFTHNCTLVLINKITTQIHKFNDVVLGEDLNLPVVAVTSINFTILVDSYSMWI